MTLLDQYPLVGSEQIKLADQPKQAWPLAVIDDRQYAVSALNHPVRHVAKRFIRARGQRRARQRGERLRARLSARRKKLGKRQYAEQHCILIEHRIQTLTPSGRSLREASVQHIGVHDVTNEQGVQRIDLILAAYVIAAASDLLSQDRALQREHAHEMGDRARDEQGE